jgi:hypothetical protein
MQKTDLLIPPIQIPPCLTTPVTATAGPTAALLLGCLALLSYTVSFFLPALHNVLGFQAFVYSILFLIGAPMWVANPLFWYGLVSLFRRRNRAAGKAGLVALLLALSECWMFHGQLAAGYFVWAGSMALLALAGWLGGEGNRPRTGSGRAAGWPAGEATQIASRFRR